MKDKLILSNNVEIAIESGSSLSDMKVLSATKSEMLETWDMLTSENLKNIMNFNQSILSISLFR